MSCQFMSQGYFLPMIRKDGTPGREFIFSKAYYNYWKAGGDPRDLALQDGVEYGEIPCKKCVPCRLKYSREWAIRCMHENIFHDKSVFVSLTYAPEYIPQGDTLFHRDFELFMKRLRKNSGITGIKYYMCGEYGTKTFRPHYHAVLFGISFDDLKLYKISKGFPLYKSQWLQDTWQKGFCTVGAFTFETAAYCSRYILKKFYKSGGDLDLHYRGRKPEYCLPSRRPGLGKVWYDEFKEDMLQERKVLVKKKGSPVLLPAPAYYDKFFKEDYPLRYEEIKKDRMLYLSEHSDKLTSKRVDVYRECFARKFQPFERDFSDEDI